MIGDLPRSGHSTKRRAGERTHGGPAPWRTPCRRGCADQGPGRRLGGRIQTGLPPTLIDDPGRGPGHRGFDPFIGGGLLGSRQSRARRTATLIQRTANARPSSIAPSTNHGHLYRRFEAAVSFRSSIPAGCHGRWQTKSENAGMGGTGHWPVPSGESPIGVNISRRIFPESSDGLFFYHSRHNRLAGSRAFGD